MPTNSQNVDYSKPHAFEMEVGRITRVCKCGMPQGTSIHAIQTLTDVQQAEYIGRKAALDTIHESNIPQPIIPYTKHTNTCLQKADDDMPLFVLKPTDPLAICVIEYWYMMGLVEHVSPAKLEDALIVRNAFGAWQVAHPDRMKLPD